MSILDLAQYGKDGKEMACIVNILDAFPTETSELYKLAVTLNFAAAKLERDAAALRCLRDLCWYLWGGDVK